MRVIHSSEIADDPAAFQGDYVPVEDVATTADLERIAAFCEQTARDGIPPSTAWFTETAAAIRAVVGGGKDGRYFIPYGTRVCSGCSQPEGVLLHVGRTGFSVRGGFEHKRECPMNFCPHGKRWAGADAEDCAACDAERVDEEGE